MKGIVFTEFLDMVELHHGLEVLDAVLQAAAPANGGAYTAVGTYDWRELVALVDALVAHRGGSPAEVLRAYGRHLFPILAARFPAFLRAHDSAVDLLASVETIIHPEVQKLHPDAELPHFATTPTTTGLALEYASERPLGEFARGMIEGCLAHFGGGGELEAHGAGGRWSFRITAQEAAPCPTA